MNFTNQDYLSSNDLEVLIVSSMPNEKAELVFNKVKKYLFFHNNNLYKLDDETKCYKALTSSKDEIEHVLLHTVSKLIEESYKALNKDKQEVLKLKHKSAFERLFENCSIKRYYSQLYMLFKDNQIDLDNYTRQIHFSNGYIDMNKSTFKQRKANRDYVTYCIPREYTPSTKEQRDKVYTHLRKVYPDNDDLESILLMLGSALTGESNQDCNTLFLLGNGSAGKSFIMELTSLAIEGYLQKLQGDTFVKGNPYAMKVLNSLSQKPYTLICWVNEMVCQKINGPLFKSFVDGTVCTTQLYKDGQNEIEHKAKLFVTSNELPSIQIDSGSSRRIIGMTHVSEFTSDKSLVDKTKNIYLKIPNLHQKLEQQGLLNAYVDILLLYGRKWIAGIKPNYSDNFLNTKDTIVSSNDFFQDLVDYQLIITNDESHRIGKDAMFNKFKECFPEKHNITLLHVIAALKDKKIIYQPKFRVNNKQGCFIGVQFRNDDGNSSTEDINEGVKNDKKRVTFEEGLKAENDKLKQQLKEMQALLSKKK